MPMSDEVAAHVTFQIKDGAWWLEIHEDDAEDDEPYAAIRLTPKLVGQMSTVLHRIALDYNRENN